MFVHPEVLRALAEGKMQDMRREQLRNVRISAFEQAPPEPTIALRLARVADDRALARLAALEERPVPEGRLLIAELDGRLVAALPLDGGEALRDPFVRTSHLQHLLEVRVAQLNYLPRPKRGLRPRGFRQHRYWASV